MRVLFNWLKDYVEIEESVEEIAEKLTMAGFEVEYIHDFKKDFQNIKTAKVLNVSPHPNADKLKVCDVSIGSNTLKVVCGAPNVEKDANVIIALPGTELKAGRIEKSVIRGVESYGMLCSEKELGLALHSEGIAVLPKEVPIGIDLWHLYKEIDDFVIDVSITPNRGDCLSHLGIAREIAAITGRQIKSSAPEFELLASSDFASIIIESPKLCPRYTGKLIENVSIKPSPIFIKLRLLACGMRPINNIVDITNYIMLDVGQPLHAFDYDLIKDKTIIVRNAKENEKLITLDGKERTLTKDDLVIADKERAIALAGVMGGLESEVTEKTKNIFLESAFFNPPTIRKTAKRLALQSEASYRFERCIDIENVPIAAEKAAQMMRKYADGKASFTILDCYPTPHQNRHIIFRPERCSIYLGTDEPINYAEKRLKLLGFEVNKKRTEWDIKVPSYRSDVSIEEDIYEEIARLGFYKEIKPLMPTISMKAREDNNERLFYNSVRQFLVDNGATEIITYSFIPEKDVDKLLLLDKLKTSLVYIKNPLTEEAVVMRPNLVANHLSVSVLNHSRLNYNFKLFEIGKKYLLDIATEKKNFIEKKVLSLVFSGLVREKTWYSKEEPYSLFDVKGFIELLINRVLKSKIMLKQINHEVFPFLHPKESGEILVGQKSLGFMGLIHPDITSKYDLKKTVYVAEIDLEQLFQLFAHKTVNYFGISKFPWVDRDITVIAEENLCNQDILAVIFENAEDILKDVKLIDVYRGENIGKNKKSMTYKLFYQSTERTLSDEEVNLVNEKIARSLINKLNIEFPK